MHQLFLRITLSILGCTYFANAQTSQENLKLKDALARFPQADMNGDGILTMEEAQAFKKKNSTEVPDKKATTADKKEDRGNSHIYKTIGENKLPLFIDAPKDHKSDAKAPAILFFHGGGFRSGSEDQFERQSKYLADRGMVGIRVRYRLTRDKGVEVTDCVEDAISAMRWVRSNAGKLGIDPDRIAASGGSAGGYLSAATLMIDHINAATDPSGVSAKPNAMVLFNPGFGNREQDGTDLRDPDGKGNLVKYVKPGQAPTIIFHGKEDKTVPIATVDEFTAAMKKAENRCELIAYEGVGHSFFNQGKYYELTIAETEKFLASLGWLKKNAETPPTSGAQPNSPTKPEL